MFKHDVNISGPSKMPESLVRVQRLTGKSVIFHEADLCDKDSLRSVFAKVRQHSTVHLFFLHFATENIFFIQHKIDVVIHFAALKAVGESCSQPLRYYGNNVTGSSVCEDVFRQKICQIDQIGIFFSMQNLMEVMMEYGVKRIVFSSSATVYGNPDYLPIDEKHPTGRCTNPYGKTKFFMEEIMKDVCAANMVFHNLSIFNYSLLSLFMCRIGVACFCDISILLGHTHPARSARTLREFPTT